MFIKNVSSSIKVHDKKPRYRQKYSPLLWKDYLKKYIGRARVVIQRRMAKSPKADTINDLETMITDKSKRRES